MSLGTLVREAQEFNSSHHSIAAGDIDDLDKALRRRLHLGVNDQRFGNFDACHRRRSTPTPRMLHDAYVGIDSPRLAEFRLDIDPFLHPRTQIVWQEILLLITGVREESVMDISPVDFKVRVHSRERTFHRGLLARGSRGTADSDQVVHCRAGNVAATVTVHGREREGDRSMFSV